MKMWLDKHFHDFQNDGNLVHRVINFVDTQITKDMETIGKTITKLLAHQVPTILLFYSFFNFFIPFSIPFHS